MAYTRHGHHIPGTKKQFEGPSSVARCGGPRLCPVCKKDVDKYLEDFMESPEMTVNPFESQIINEPTDYPYMAKMVVAQYVAEQIRSGRHSIKLAGGDLPGYEIYVVWFCKVLGNWKALLSTTLPDGMYYEVTYNGNEREAYVDAYSKTDNIVIKD